MSMNIETCPELDFLRVNATGNFSLEEAKRTFLEMLEAVARHKVKKVLFDGRRLTGEPKVMERFYYGEFVAQTGQLIYAASALQILRAEKSEELQALDLLAKYSDQRVSFCDCVSFALLKRSKLQNVFGFDRHFECAGFRLWPRT